MAWPPSSHHALPFDYRRKSDPDPVRDEYFPARSDPYGKYGGLRSHAPRHAPAAFDRSASSSPSRPSRMGVYDLLNAELPPEPAPTSVSFTPPRDEPTSNTRAHQRHRSWDLSSPFANRPLFNSSPSKGVPQMHAPLPYGYDLAAAPTKYPSYPLAYHHSSPRFFPSSEGSEPPLTSDTLSEYSDAIDTPFYDQALPHSPPFWHSAPRSRTSTSPDHRQSTHGLGASSRPAAKHAFWSHSDTLTRASSKPLSHRPATFAYSPYASPDRPRQVQSTPHHASAQYDLVRVRSADETEVNTRNMDTAMDTDDEDELARLLRISPQKRVGYAVSSERGRWDEPVPMRRYRPRSKADTLPVPTPSRNCSQEASLSPVSSAPPLPELSDIPPITPSPSIPLVQLEHSSTSLPPFMHSGSCSSASSSVPPLTASSAKSEFDFGMIDEDIQADAGVLPPSSPIADSSPVSVPVSLHVELDLPQLQVSSEANEEEEADTTTSMSALRDRSVPDSCMDESASMRISHEPEQDSPAGPSTSSLVSLPQTPDHLLATVEQELRSGPTPVLEQQSSQAVSVTETSEPAPPEHDGDTHSIPEALRIGSPSVAEAFELVAPVSAEVILSPTGHDLVYTDPVQSAGEHGVVATSATDEVVCVSSASSPYPEISLPLHEDAVSILQPSGPLLVNPAETAQDVSLPLESSTAASPVDDHVLDVTPSSDDTLICTVTSMAIDTSLPNEDAKLDEQGQSMEDQGQTSMVVSSPVTTVQSVFEDVGFDSPSPPPALVLQALLPLSRTSLSPLSSVASSRANTPERPVVLSVTIPTVIPDIAHARELKPPSSALLSPMSISPISPVSMPPAVIPASELSQEDPSTVSLFPHNEASTLDIDLPLSPLSTPAMSRTGSMAPDIQHVIPEQSSSDYPSSPLDEAMASTVSAVTKPNAVAKTPDRKDTGSDTSASLKKKAKSKRQLTTELSPKSKAPGSRLSHGRADKPPPLKKRKSEGSSDSTADIGHDETVRANASPKKKRRRNIILDEDDEPVAVKRGSKATAKEGVSKHRKRSAHGQPSKGAEPDAPRRSASSPPPPLAPVSAIVATPPKAVLADISHSPLVELTPKPAALALQDTSSPSEPKKKKSRHKKLKSDAQRNQPAKLSAPSSELAEFRGMVIEAFAGSRASALSPTVLYRSVIASRPALLTQRPEQEWLAFLSDVLEDGARTCGVFGRVDSSGKDERDRPLEARWFYCPDRDDDQERAALVRSMNPRAEKRSETKKYKQYYWRPLGKISRWDSEDAM